MVSPQVLFDAMREQDIRFFTGVPDSLLKSFCAYVMDHTDADSHVIAANEGNAIALASGHFLGSGRPALVYMQNSGLGNAVNPLTSLADPDVYGIPMLVIVGWRGAPGVPDEPQHAKQGRIMQQLLDALEYPCWTLDADTPNAEGLIEDACRVMRQQMSPVVLLVKPGTFESYRAQRVLHSHLPLTREDAIKSLVDRFGRGAIVVSTTGKVSRELYEYREARGDGHGNDFLTVGSMGHTASIAMGLAMAQPQRRVICLDGDGSALMHMGSLAVVGQSGLDNLLHVVLNNGAHDSVGGQPTVAMNVSITKVAQACGYAEAICVQDEEALAATCESLGAVSGPALLEVRVSKGARADLGRPKSSPVQNRDALMAQLGIRTERTET